MLAAVPASSALARDSKGGMKGFSLKGWRFGARLRASPSITPKLLRGVGRALCSLLAKVAGAEGKAVCGKGGVRKPPKWVTNCRLQAWRSCSASFSAELGRFKSHPCPGLPGLAQHNRCRLACA